MTADGEKGRQDTVRAVTVLFAMCVFGQRLAIPGTPVAALLPGVATWLAWSYRRRLVHLDGSRVLIWLLAGIGAVVVTMIQALCGTATHVSVSSLGLFLATWAIFCFRLSSSDHRTFEEVVQRCIAIGLVVAVASVAFVLLQMLGLGYQDVVRAVLPDPLVLDGYVTTYPLYYGSGIMRSNAWFGLESSVVSFELGALLLAGVAVGAGRGKLLVLLLGTVATAGGSGLLVVLIGLILMLLTSDRGRVVRVLPPIGVGLVVLAVTPLGQSVFGRVSEGSSENSSTTLRAVRALEDIGPLWASDVWRLWFGLGAGASQQFAENEAVTGLVAPTTARVFIDYGLMGGSLLAAMIVSAHLGSRLPALAGALLVSFWTLQPATTNIALLGVLLVLCALWTAKSEEQRLAAPARPIRVAEVAP